MTVLYRGDHPETAQLGSFMDRWFLPLFFLCTGALVAFVGRLIGRGDGKVGA